MPWELRHWTSHATKVRIDRNQSYSGCFSANEPNLQVRRHSPRVLSCATRAPEYTRTRTRLWMFSSNKPNLSVRGHSLQDLSYARVAKSMRTNTRLWSFSSNTTNQSVRGHSLQELSYARITKSTPTYTLMKIARPKTAHNNCLIVFARTNPRLRLW